MLVIFSVSRRTMHTVTRNTNETRNSFNKRDSNKNLTDNCRFLCQENNYYKISLVYYIIILWRHVSTVYSVQTKAD